MVPYDDILTFESLQCKPVFVTKSFVSRLMVSGVSGGLGNRGALRNHSGREDGLLFMSLSTTTPGGVIGNMVIVWCIPKGCGIKLADRNSILVE